MFLTTQMYEEAKHADFFDRYWDEVVHPLEDEVRAKRSCPSDAQWYDKEYRELFDRGKKPYTASSRTTHPRTWRVPFVTTTSWSKAYSHRRGTTV